MEHVVKTVFTTYIACMLLGGCCGMLLGACCIMKWPELKHKLAKHAKKIGNEEQDYDGTNMSLLGGAAD